MLNKNLRMTDAVGTYRDLLAREMRGPSDAEGAMHRIQSKYGLDYWVQWGLRFRPPKRITTDLTDKVRQAYLSTLEASVRRDLARLQVEAAKGANDDSVQELLAEAADLLSRISQKKESR